MMLYFFRYCTEHTNVILPCDPVISTAKVTIVRYDVTNSAKKKPASSKL
jgi:hypothetical protein